MTRRGSQSLSGLNKGPRGDEVISESLRRLLGMGHSSGPQPRGTRSFRVVADQIHELQSQDNLKGRFVIVDVRSKAETDVSIIPGAVTKSEFERTETLHAGKVVIVYCTMGVRSGVYVRRLKSKGWNAWNYRGSILDWCKNMHPLTTLDGKATNQVHTYSRWLSVPQEYVAVY